MYDELTVMVEGILFAILSTKDEVERCPNDTGGEVVRKKSSWCCL